MKKIISLAITCFISATAFCQTKISIDSVSQHVGHSVTVCGKVYGVKSLEKVTLINLGAAYPNSPLTVVIFARDRASFKQPIDSLFNDKNVCVTGMVKDYNGKPEIIVSGPGQLVIQ